MKHIIDLFDIQINLLYSRGLMKFEEKEAGDSNEKTEEGKLSIGGSSDEYQVKVKLVLMGQKDSTWSIVKKCSKVDYRNFYLPSTVDFGYNEYNVDT